MSDAREQILITGGAGFIGTNLCRRLVADGHEVIVLDDFSTGDRDNLVELDIEIIRHDVTKPFSVGCTQLYHLACPASPVAYQSDPASTVMTAVQGTFNALTCAAEAGARIVVASTSEVYGEPLRHPQDEADLTHFNPVGPRSCYDAGKAAAESLAVAFADDYHQEVHIARIFNTYGPYMDPQDGRVISNFINQALDGETLTIYGDGTQTRSFCYIDDMVDGLVALMTTPLGIGTPFNLGNPHEVSVNEIARHVLRLIGADVPASYEDLPGDDPTRRCPNIDKARRILRFHPAVSLEDGLVKTIDYFRELREGGLP